MSLEVDPVGMVILAWVLAPAVAVVVLYWLIRFAVAGAIRDAWKGAEDSPSVGG